MARLFSFFFAFLFGLTSIYFRLQRRLCVFGWKQKQHTGRRAGTHIEHGQRFVLNYEHTLQTVRQLLIFAAVSISPAFDRSSSRRWTRRSCADPTRGHTAKEFYSSTIQLLKFPKVKLTLVSCCCDSTCRPLLFGCSPAPNSRSSSFELCVGVCVCTRVCDRQR